MAGVRPLTKSEVEQVSRAFSGRYEKRNRALFLTQYYTGRRITQTLALKIADVVNDHGQINERVWYRRATVKGKTSGEVKVLHPAAQKALAIWLGELYGLGFMVIDSFLFQSQARGNKPLSRHAAYQVYKRAFKQAGLEGRLGTHSLRKAFGQVMYEALGHDIRKTQEALGHKSLGSTAHYLAVDTRDIEKTMLEAL